jgi:hypothetical protein
MKANFNRRGPTTAGGGFAAYVGGPVIFTFYGMNIPVGLEGHILDSKHAGHVIRVEDDIANTGGFLVFQRWSGSDGPNGNGEFDDWVENLEALESYFVESGLQVHWGKR